MVKNPTASVRNIREACQCRRCGFDSWFGKIPLERSWLPTLVFLPGESHGLRSLVGYSPQDHKELDTIEDLRASRTKDSGGRNGNPLQYSCLKNPMDRGAWWATVQGGCKELDMTECICMRAHTHTHTHTHTQCPSLSLTPYLGLKSALSEINIIYIFFFFSFLASVPPSLCSPR